MNSPLLNNRYRILKDLGAGGFGNTYLAEDTQMPSSRKCVIKQLKPVTYNPEVYRLVQERFGREAAVLEKLGEHSAQIPRLYAYFTEEGQFYLVQEWIEGITLTQKLQQFGVLGELEVREILVELLSVLEFVHKQGIVHRDIKPDNIILRSTDGKPVLIDFGAVRETVATQLNSQGHTTSSIIIGTLGFMPVEQAAGRPVYGSDLYSLGLTAIYLLTGKMPQQLPTDSISGEIIWDKQGISPYLANVLDKAARSHPRDRFPSAKAMLEALQTQSVAPLEPTLIPTQPFSPIPPQHVSSREISPAILNTAPPAPKNNSNSIILGTLIASGLIGGAVVIGTLIKDSRSPIPVASVLSPSVSPSAIAKQSPLGSIPLTPTPATTAPSVVIVSPTATPIAVASVTPKIVGSATPVAPAITPETSNSEDLPFFMVRPVTEADLQGKSKLELDLIRNEIFARYGRRFQRPDLQEYFNNQSWYTPKYSPNDFPESLLKPVQRRNVLFIAKYQTKL